jgi:hypothetical protein
MHAIRKLRELGFEFFVSKEKSREQGAQDKGSGAPTGNSGAQSQGSGARHQAPKTRIRYRFIGEQRPSKEVTDPLFAELKRRKREAVEYLTGPHFQPKEYCDEDDWETARLYLKKFGFFLLESELLDDTIAVLSDGVEQEQIPALNTGCFRNVPCYTAEEVRKLWKKVADYGLQVDGLRMLHEAKRGFDGRIVR